MVSSSSSSVSTDLISTTIPVRLDDNNFSLWRGLALPNLAGANLHHHLDQSMVAPVKTVQQGTGDKAIAVTNPEYINGGLKISGLWDSSSDPWGGHRRAAHQLQDGCRGVGIRPFHVQRAESGEYSPPASTTSVSP
jgi:hypothetical protein